MGQNIIYYEPNRNTTLPVPSPTLPLQPSPLSNPPLPTDKDPPLPTCTCVQYTLLKLVTII